MISMACSTETATTSCGFDNISNWTIASPIIPSLYNSKNAGRKKTNPVWNFFVDLKCKGLSGVRCRYCEWITNDRSPTTLKFHLKRKHDTGVGGIWNIVGERIGLSAPQNRSRNGKNGDSDIDGKQKGEKELDYPETSARIMVDAHPSSSQQALLDQFIQNATQNHSRMSSQELENKCHDSAESVQKSGPSTSNFEFDKVSLTEGVNSQYSLSDGNNISQLLQVAADMDLTFTFNSRRTCEYCFESNSLDMRGKTIVFGDLGTKISVTERFKGKDQNYEEWIKADWSQFIWALRGKCMNSF